MLTAAQQAASWRIRRRNRSAQFTAQATPWSAGLVCPPGAICQSEGMAWQTAAGGTTAGTAGPDNSAGATFTDGGGVVWSHAWLLTTAPAPIT